MKVCRVCTVDLPDENFHVGYRQCKKCTAIKARAAYLKRKAEDPAKIREHKRKWRMTNREKHLAGMRRRSLKRLYGILPEQYDAMFAAQNGCCAICLRSETQIGRRLHVDHCHDTGTVRKLLCGNCNSAIAKLQHSPEIMRKAASYIEEFPIS